MPRKRTTRVKAVAQPPKGIVKIAEGMSENQRNDQLTIILRDFDSKVQNVLKDIEKKKRSMKADIMACFESDMAMVPQEIKNMTLKEFAMAGGEINAAVSWVRVHSRKLNRREEMERLKCKAAHTEEEVLDIINEENLEATDVVQETPMTKVKPMRGKSKNPPRSKFITPSHSIGRGAWGKTPLITPKFDPNLPSTPDNIRKMKPGERLMSLAGSPVEVEQQQHTAIRGRGIKKEIAAQMSDIVGVDITPNRVEKMLSLVAETINAANRKV
ncbi:unnamed protein product [Lymnaea stagnalis]|uniref:Borealin N-terminal domain-containing protein n=1 Tax=Lymnaea stagnalis TaxID=6523 RepID=A0AAV2HUI4_LYMST